MGDLFGDHEKTMAFSVSGTLWHLHAGHLSKISIRQSHCLSIKRLRFYASFSSTFCSIPSPLLCVLITSFQRSTYAGFACRQLQMRVRGAYEGARNLVVREPFSSISFPLILYPPRSPSRAAKLAQPAPCPGHEGCTRACPAHGYRRPEVRRGTRHCVCFLLITHHPASS
ncbi:hypothetical protein B0H10DRAFT_2068150 [Mycena sp. CBHHK59/15]|nr:hypothetical protein B0H10DRAFT_2068150 [Mycena sp. CBHHK59/15]